ncbi:MAG: hypothetical protein R8K22_03960, partial [Mariprofundaceae bacterium]
MQLMQQKSQLLYEKSLLPQFNYWLLAFLLMLMLNAGLVLMYLYRERLEQWKSQLMSGHQEKGNLSKTVVSSPEMTEESMKMDPTYEADDVLSESFSTVDQEMLSFEDTLHLIEEDIQRAMYKQAEERFDQFDTEQSRTVKVLVLRVLLLHKSGRIQERNALVLERFKEADDQAWHLFSHRISSEIWHSLQDSGVVNGKGQLVVEDQLLMAMSEGDLEDTFDDLLSENGFEDTMIDNSAKDASDSQKNAALPDTDGKI